MTQAKVAILLISANFLTSDFTLKTEVPRLLKRHQNEGLVVFPVIAKPCAWQRVEWLARMNVRPRNGTPVWREGGLHADDELAAIANEIAQIVEKAVNVTPAGTATSKAPPSPQPSPPTATSASEPVTKPARNWGRIGAIAAIVGALATILACIVSTTFNIFPLWTVSPTPTPTSVQKTSFSYQTRVQAKDSNENIPNAQVTIEVPGRAPLDGITDSNGLARIQIAASHSGQPGRLIVEANGYHRYVQEIDLTRDALPDLVRLEPVP